MSDINKCLAACQEYRNKLDKLEAENSELRNELARVNNQTNWVCKCGGTDCEGQRENAALRELMSTLGAPNHINIPVEKWRELRADKERLDWLESLHSLWEGTEKTGPVFLTRAAIDAARKGAQP